VTRIRRARINDVGAIVRMGCRFIAESAYRGLLTPNPAQQERLTQQLLDNEHAAVFVVDVAGEVVGMLGIALVVSPIAGELVGTEVAWWVDPEFRGGSAGVRLWAAAEQWAEDQGAIWIQMSAPAGNDVVRRMYRKAGYSELETTFQKRLRAA